MKRKEWLATLALALLVPAAGRADTAAKAPAANGKKPVITIAEPSFNFGDLYHQDQYAHTFTVKNTGTADLLVEDVKPG